MQLVHCPRVDIGAVLVLWEATVLRWQVWQGISDTQLSVSLFFADEVIEEFDEAFWNGLINYLSEVAAQPFANQALRLGIDRSCALDEIRITACKT